MKEQHAYNFGVFVKCAEAGVSPQDLHAHGQRTGNHQLMKLAQAAHAGASVTPMEKAALLDMLRRGAGRVGDSFKALGRAGDEIGDYRFRQQWAGDMSRQADEAAETAGHVKGHMTGQARTGDLSKTEFDELAGQGLQSERSANRLRGRAAQVREQASRQLGAYGKEVLPAVGLTAGAGGAGLAYGMGPADTTGNKLRGLSNQYLGTDLDQQSRLGSLFG